MNIETKEFWEKVKEEYNPLKYASICGTSPTFRIMWNDLDIHEDLLVIEHAKSFLKEINCDTIICGTWFLFDSEDVEIRKQFIDYMINKFS